MIGWVSLWRNESEAENDGVRRKTPTNKRGQEPNGGGTKPNTMTSHDAYMLVEFTKFYQVAGGIPLRL